MASSARCAARHGSSAWKITDGRITLEVSVPPNCTAEVHVPRSGAVTNDGGTLRRDTSTHAVYAVGAGDYRFTALL